MGDVHNRGTKDQPQWYCRFINSDSKRKHRPTHQPTKTLAMRYSSPVSISVAPISVVGGMRPNSAMNSRSILAK